MFWIGSNTTREQLEDKGGWTGQALKDAETFPGWMIDELIKSREGALDGYGEDAREALSNWSAVRVEADSGYTTYECVSEDVVKVLDVHYHEALAFWRKDGSYTLLVVGTANDGEGGVRTAAREGHAGTLDELLGAIYGVCEALDVRNYG